MCYLCVTRNIKKKNKKQKKKWTEVVLSREHKKDHREKIADSREPTNYGELVNLQKFENDWTRQPSREAS